MNLRRARGIFRLDCTVTVEQLNTLFRDLVKKYHPDKVRDHPQWAHERMSEINEAYETLVKQLSAVDPESDGAYGFDGKTSEGPREQPARDTPFSHAARMKTFQRSFKTFIEGLGLYYQYGLENPAYRNEGVRRFRCREALRSIEKARESMERLAENSHQPAIAAAARFGRLTAADIHLGSVQFPGTGAARRFDERFRSARRDLDAAVKEVLFPELIPGHLRGRYTAALPAAYAEFVLFLSMFDHGERRKAAILQTARYDAFMELLECRDSGLLLF